MRWKHYLWLAFIVVLAFALFVGFGIGVPLLYRYWGAESDDIFRAIPGLLGVGVTSAGLVIALAQYMRNSNDRRIERSMAFWQRSNTEEFTRHLTPYLEHLRKLNSDEDVPEFEKIARSPAVNEKLHEAIEYLLDFYDEACTGVVTRACDEKAMHCYLGSMIVRESKFLAGYVQVCLKKYKRPEKWSAFLLVAERWLRGRSVNSWRRISD